MLALVLALLALAAAPGIDWLSRRRPGVEAALDGGVQAVVLGVVLLIVLPYGVETAGASALGLMLAGVAVSVLLHRLPGFGAATAGMAVAALLLHALVDGAALAAPMGDANPLAAAVILHVMPVGLAAWRVARLRAGTQRAALLLVATGACMTAGFVATGAVTSASQAGPTALALSGLAGALLSALHHAPNPARRLSEGLGSALGLLLVLALLTQDHEHAHGAPLQSLGVPLVAALLGLRLLLSPKARAPDATRDEAG